MTAYRLTEAASRRVLIDAPETGPGYQYVRVDPNTLKDAIPQGTYMVFNAEHFIPINNPIPPGAASYEEWVECLDFEDKTLLVGATVRSLTIMEQAADEHLFEILAVRRALGDEG